jgi:hypothetical protein
VYTCATVAQSITLLQVAQELFAEMGRADSGCQLVEPAGRKWLHRSAV